MASPGLLGRYRLYKAGTNKLVQWLAHSASRCCDLASIIKSTGSGSNDKPSHASPKSSSVHLRTQELVKLAQAIASSNPPVEISHTILDVAKDVIAGRKECASWYASQTLQGGSKLEQENESHRYFIMVLQKILKLLTEARASRPKSKDSKASKPTTKRRAAKDPQQDDLTNLFACLEIEECSASPLGDTPSSAGTQSPRIPLVHYSLEEDNDDSAFAVWCFLQDLHDVRKAVLETWKEYRQGDVSFLVASSITNTAFGLLRCAGEDFAKISPVQSSAWSDLSDYLGIGFYSHGDAIWMCPDTLGVPPRCLDTKINPVELLCPLGFLSLMHYKDDATSACLQSQGKHRSTDTTNICADDDHANEAEDGRQFVSHEFHQALKLLVPELHALAHQPQVHCDHCDVLDEFVRGLVELHRNNNAPMWLVVACQIYIDIYDLLGHRTTHGATVLDEAYSRQRQTAADLDDYVVDVMDRMDDPQNVLGYMISMAKWARGYEKSVALPHVSPKAKTRMTDNNHHHGTKTPSAASAMMERHLPAHAGAILADVKIEAHSAGCRMANVGGFVLSAAHLYKALQVKGLITTDWHDMDFFLASFGAKQPLVARATDTTDSIAAARHYLMALGMPATEFARNKRAGSTRTFKKGHARQLTVTSPFLQGMDVRLCNNTRAGSEVSRCKAIEVTLQIMMSNAAKSVAGQTRGGVGSHRRDSFTPLQLLATFKTSLLAHEAQLNFNYISFTTSCIRLVQKTTDDAALQLGLQAFGRLYADTQVVSELIESAASGVAARNAAHIMQDHIATTGKQFVKEAFDQSSGRIPRHLRPVIEPRVAPCEEMKDMARTILDYAGVKYMFSGGIMAAYHFALQTECCNADCSNHKHNSKMTPEGPVHQPQVTIYRSPIPDAILEQSLASIDQDPAKYLAARDRFLAAAFTEFTSCDCDPSAAHEDQFRTFVANWTGLKLAPLRKAPSGMTPWAYIIPSEYDRYAAVRDECVHLGLAAEDGAYVLWPVDFGSARVAAARQDGLIHSH